jgi:hypothetical protein
MRPAIVAFCLRPHGYSPNRRANAPFYTTVVNAVGGCGRRADAGCVSVHVGAANTHVGLRNLMLTGATLMLSRVTFLLTTLTPYVDSPVLHVGASTYVDGRPLVCDVNIKVSGALFMLTAQHKGLVTVDVGRNIVVAGVHIMGCGAD